MIWHAVRRISVQGVYFAVKKGDIEREWRCVPKRSDSGCISLEHLVQVFLARFVRC